MARVILNTVMGGVEDPPAVPEEIESVYIGMMVQGYGRWLVEHDGRWYVEDHPE